MRLYGRFCFVLAACLGGLTALGTRPFLQHRSLPPSDILEFSTPAVDFGEVVEGATCERELLVTNNSSYAASIVELGSTCGCARLDIPDRNPIAPGSSTKAVVTLHTRSRQGPQNQRITAKCILAKGDSPFYQDLQLNVAANVRREYSTVPEALDFGEVMIGTKVGRRVELRSSAIRKWQPYLLVPIDGWDLEVMPRETADPVISTSVTVRVTAIGTPGRRSTLLTIDPGPPSVAPISIPISMICVSRFRVEPAQITMSLPTTGQSQLSEVIICRIDDSISPEWRIANTPSWCEVSHRVSGNQLRIEIKPTGSFPPKSISRGMIEIATGDPAEPTVVVPINVIARDR